MGAGQQSTIMLGGQTVEYRLVPSRAARRLRIKVRPDGIEVVLPEGRTGKEALAFVAANEEWAIEQLDRARRRLLVRRPEKRLHGQVLFRGEPVPVKVIRSAGWQGRNRVLLEHGSITITSGPNCSTPTGRSLEYWLRKQARDRIEHHLGVVAERVNRSPGRVYVMGQRTKWGNCSALGNLSFNWRLIMAPEHVLRYIVTHEVVHLAVPDHSRRFWLTVQSICPDADRARQWLAANGHRLLQPLPSI